MNSRSNVAKHSEVLMKIISHAKQSQMDCVRLIDIFKLSSKCDYLRLITLFLMSLFYKIILFLLLILYVKLKLLYFFKQNQLQKCFA